MRFICKALSGFVESVIKVTISSNLNKSSETESHCIRNYVDGYVKESSTFPTGLCSVTPALATDCLITWLGLL